LLPDRVGVKGHGDSHEPISRDLQGLEELSSLLTLKLDSNELASIVPVMRVLSELLLLRDLSVSGNPFTLGSPDYAYEMTEALPSLRFLDG
jgi:hypothetical protein